MIFLEGSVGGKIPMDLCFFLETSSVLIGFNSQGERLLSSLRSATVYHLTRRAPQSSLNLLQSIGRWGTALSWITGPIRLSWMRQLPTKWLQTKRCKNQKLIGNPMMSGWCFSGSVFWTSLGLEIVALPLARSTKRHALDRTPTLKYGFFLGCETPSASVVVTGLAFGYQHGISNSKNTKHIESSYGRGPWSWFDRALGSVAGQLWLCWHWNTFHAEWTLLRLVFGALEFCMEDQKAEVRRLAAEGVLGQTEDTDFLDFCRREPRKCARPLLRLAEKAELDSAEAMAKGGYGGSKGSSEWLDWKYRRYHCIIWMWFVIV